MDDACVIAAGKKTYEGVATLNIFRDTKLSEGSPQCARAGRMNKYTALPRRRLLRQALESEKWQAL